MIVICLCYLLRMRTGLIFWVLLLILVTLGGWGMSKLLPVSDLLKISPITTLDSNSIHSSTNKPLTKSKAVEQDNPTTTTQIQKKSNDFLEIIELIKGNNTALAANAINQQHSYLTVTELGQLKQEFLILALSQQEKAAQQKNTLLVTSGIFDDLDVWIFLANSAINDHDWPLAHNANIKVSQLENDPVQLEQHFKRLLFSASKLRSNFENTNDELSINAMYQELSNIHPAYTRFQIELAFSHLRLNNVKMAKALLIALRYDTELGTVAQRTLDKINTQTQQKATVATPPVFLPKRNQVVVPLITSGSSFLIDVIIDRKKARLLLDTGASITALSSSLIAQLKLPETGQTIRISTANGLNDAKLYRVKRLLLGRLELRDMVIAEINLAPNNRFQGLLGTDALNQLKPEYSYLIDNLESALIFRQR